MSKNTEEKPKELDSVSSIYYIEGMPLAWHTNMQTGAFEPFGNAEKGVRKMRINLVAMRAFEGNMYLKKSELEEKTKDLISKLKISQEEAEALAIKENSKEFIELFFIKDFKAGKPNQPLCMFLLKTYSLANFLKEMKQYSYEFLENGEPCKFFNIAMELRTEKKSKNGKDFYEIIFKGSLAVQEESDLIADFLSTKPVIYDAGNLEENLRFSNTYKLLPSKCKNIAIPADFRESAFLLGHQKSLTQQVSNFDTQPA